MPENVSEPCAHPGSGGRFWGKPGICAQRGRRAFGGDAWEMPAAGGAGREPGSSAKPRQGHTAHPAHHMHVICRPWRIHLIVQGPWDAPQPGWKRSDHLPGPGTRPPAAGAGACTSPSRSAAEMSSCWLSECSLLSRLILGKQSVINNLFREFCLYG